MDRARLKRITAFNHLSERDLAIVATWATEFSAPAGTAIMREEDFSYDVIGIVEGTVEVVSGGRMVARLGQGDVVGEIGCLQRDLRSATVTATSPLVCIRLTGWDLRHLERDAPAAVAALRGIAEDRLAAAA